MDSLETISHWTAMNTIECWTAYDGTPLLMRPVHTDDIDALAGFYASLSHEDRRRRFHSAMNGLTAGALRRMAHIDPRREEALVITALTADGQTLIADARCVIDDNSESAEIALAVAPAWRRLGLGERCVRALCYAAAERGLRRVYGSVFAENAPMLALMKRCGFRCITSRYDARLVSASRRVGSSVVVPIRAPAYA